MLAADGAAKMGTFAAVGSFQAVRSSLVFAEPFQAAAVHVPFLVAAAQFLVAAALFLVAAAAALGWHIPVPGLTLPP